MLCVFSIPKPFEGHVGIIQRNAVATWTALAPDAEVILLGDEPGVRECAQEFGAKWIQDIATTAYGTPLVSDAFTRAQNCTKCQVMCYVNADILLPPSFPSLLDGVTFSNFLIVGRRLDVDLETRLDLSNRDWWAEVVASPGARMHPAWGMDYFLFNRGLLGQLPPFAVGRPGWDSWMIRNALERRVPLIDATPTVVVVHQNHGYAHVPGGTGLSYDGPESEQNLRLLSKPSASLTSETSPWVLEPGGLRRRRWITERFPRDLHLLFANVASILRRWIGGGA